MNLAIPRNFSKLNVAVFAVHIALALAFGFVVGALAVEPLVAMLSPAVAIAWDTNLPRLSPTSMGSATIRSTNCLQRRSPPRSSPYLPASPLVANGASLTPILLPGTRVRWICV
jgi:hypothetical protein